MLAAGNLLDPALLQGYAGERPIGVPWRGGGAASHRPMVQKGVGDGQMEIWAWVVLARTTTYGNTLRPHVVDLVMACRQAADDDVDRR